MKIVFLDRSHLQCEEETFDYSPLEHLGQFQRVDVKTKEELVSAAQGAKVLITGKLQLPQEVLAKLDGVELILKAGTSCDKIDVAAANNYGITVANLPGYGGYAVAQSTWAMLMALVGSLLPYDQAVKANQWQQLQFRYPVTELRGKTLGIIGLGAISRQMVTFAHAFGMNVTIHTRFPDPSLNVTYVELPQIADADIVTIHCMLDKRTRGMVDRPFLKRMSPKAYLINTARAAIVDEEALIWAIAENQIAGAALDGFWQEPPDKDHPLFQYDNVLLTPHIAWAPIETRQGMIHALAELIQAYFSGNPRNIVTP